MKLTVKIFSVVIFSTLLLSFCKKYEDGPAVSLRTAQNRITGDWKAYKILINGRDSSSTFLTGSNSDFGVVIDSDNLYATKGADPDNGLWQFEDNKKSIVFRSSDPNSAEEEKYTILRLKNKDLWIFRDLGNNYTIELRFQQ